MKKILVTGGAGFLGSHLCEKLLNKGHEVWSYDNFYTGKKDNIKHLYENERFNSCDIDISDADKFTFFFEGENFDEVYNLACPASPKHYQKDPIYTFNTSVHGIQNIIKGIWEQKHKCKILQASTSEVYGDPLSHPQKESDWGNVNPNGVRSCYDVGKRAAECLLYDYNRVTGLDVRAIRIFNTYGPRLNANDGRVVSNFIVQALNNEDITIYGDGSQTRSFCYVDDLLDGMMALMDSDYIYPVNIGNPGEYTIKQLAETIIELTNSKSKLVYKDLPKDDPTRRKPDISLAKEKLNWEPKIDLKEGLLKTIEYFKK